MNGHKLRTTYILYWTKVSQLVPFSHTPFFTSWNVIYCMLKLLHTFASFISLFLYPGTSQSLSNFQYHQSRYSFGQTGRNWGRRYCVTVASLFSLKLIPGNVGERLNLKSLIYGAPQVLILWPSCLMSTWNCWILSFISWESGIINIRMTFSCSSWLLTSHVMVS